MEGTKHDVAKSEWALLPWEPLEEVVKVLMRGAEKYAPNNWKHVPNGKYRYMNALMRHLISYQRGETNDPEFGLSHLAHAMCNCLFLLWFDINAPIKEAPSDSIRDCPSYEAYLKAQKEGECLPL
jgi:hypothetical protein